MREELAGIVHGVFGRGLALRERLQRGEVPELETEQAELRRLLEGPPEARRWVDFAGDDADGRPDEAKRGPTYLGIRYALTCWIDELLILHSPWDSEWNERKLEVVLYGSNDRAWRFWEQARIAEDRRNELALGVFYLCVVLGFRGEYRETPDRLQSWLGDVRPRLTRGEREWPAPPQLEETTAVPPRRGHEEMRRMAVAAGAVLLLGLPLLSYLVVRHLDVRPTFGSAAPAAGGDRKVTLPTRDDIPAVDDRPDE